MIKKYALNSRSLPIVIESDSRDKSLKLLRSLTFTHRDFFQAQLLQYGALLFRGFRVQTIDEFKDFIRYFSGEEFFNYAGGVSPRLPLKSNIYTSTEYPSYLRLDLHNELSYAKSYPHHLYFFCETAPTSGGETTLGDSRRILRNIRPKIVGLFKHKKVLYQRHLSADKGSGYSWQEAFETDNKEEVEKICRKLEADFEWQPNDELEIKQISPAVTRHPTTGEEVWFNQAHGFHPSGLDDQTSPVNHQAGKHRLNSFFGDGSPMCVLMLEHIRQVLRNEVIPLRWQTGDILILDNILTAHGRMPFHGMRKIAVAMT